MRSRQALSTRRTSLQGGQELFGEGFVLGSGTLSYASYFSAFGLTYAGSYGTGTQNIPLNIPFSTLGSNFQLLITLETYEDGSSLTGNQWDSDYYHTLTASLVAPAGVTLTSASGAFPGTSAVPEPKSAVFVIGGFIDGYIAAGIKKASGEFVDTGDWERRDWHRSFVVEVFR
jgi:hypothetical protein